MFKIKGTTIDLIRGDTLITKINIYKDGEEYIPQEYDLIRFALKSAHMRIDKTEFIDKEPLITKVIPNETLILKLDSEDTKNLSFGTYKYDIQITMEDGTVDTFIAGTLNLKPEVA